MDESNDVVVTENAEKQRFEAVLDGKPAGFAAYNDAKELRVFTHTEVDPRFEGRGIGGALARAGLEDARARGLKVLPLCPFIKDWIGKHRDYVDVVYDSRPSTAKD